LNLLEKILYLQDSLLSEEECSLANEAYEKINHNDIWEVYAWYDKYFFKDYARLDVNLLNLDFLSDGYFTFKDFLPKLRFSGYGHTEFLTFGSRLELAFQKTEEIRKETLFDDIELEWYWEDDERIEPPDEYFNNSYED